MWSICWFSGIPFLGFETYKRSDVLEGGRFANIHEYCFQSEKRSDMDCVELQGGLFAERHEWHSEAAKRSDMSSTIMQEGRFAHVQE